MKFSTATATLVAALVWALPAAAQTTLSFEQVVADLASPDAGVRRVAAAALKQAAYPEAAVPLARVILDPEDAVQLEAIGAELNIFLADKVTPRKRVALVVEVRGTIAAEPIFTAGPAVLEASPVPLEVLDALRSALRDNNPRVALEALYAFGALAANAYGPARQQLLSASAADLASVTGSSRDDLRAAAVRVMGRVYRRQPGDAPVPETVGDAVVAALNDRSAAIRLAAMDALGGFRYERALQALTELFEHHGRTTAGVAAFEAVARTGHVSSQPLFIANLASRDALVRRLSIEGLARIGDRGQVAEIIARTQQERSEEVVLAGHFAGVLLSDGRVDPIADGLSRSRTRPIALAYLIEVAPGRAGAIAVHAQDPDLAVRRDVIDVLAQSGDAEAIAALERIAQDVDPSVASAARRGAERLKARLQSAP